MRQNNGHTLTNVDRGLRIVEERAERKSPTRLRRGLIDEA